MSEPAFPTAQPDRLSQHHDPEFVVQGGLTKREYFAALALQGLLANSANTVNSFEMDAENSVLAADKLIEALAAQKKK